MSTATRMSRSAAKAKVRELRAAAAVISNLLDTMARNPEWAEANEAYVLADIQERLNEIDGTNAQLREGLLGEGL